MEQFGALYMHNHDDKYPARSGFEKSYTYDIYDDLKMNKPFGLHGLYTRISAL